MSGVSFPGWHAPPTKLLNPPRSQLRRHLGPKELVLLKILKIVVNVFSASHARRQPPHHVLC